MASNQQFIRQCSLLVASNSGEGIDLSQAHFTFHIEQGDDQSPNNAVIRVYNLAPETVRRITGRTPVEFTTVKVQSGYLGGPLGSIFQGTIQQFGLGRETPVDTYLDIMAADGDYSYTTGIVSQTFRKGSQPQERVQAITKSMGLSDGYMPKFTGTELWRGKVLFGMARDALAAEARTQNATWSIQDGKVNIVPLDKYIPGTAVVINAGTGMIGVPALTEQGVNVRVLLNPTIRVGYLIKIDNASLNRVVQQQSALPIRQNQYTGLFRVAATNADGLYRVYVAEHSGDTRGNEYYTDLIALAVDDTTKTVQPNGITSMPPAVAP